MDIVLADTKGRNVRQLADCRLECAWGVDENDFAFSCPPERAPEAGWRVYAVGTELGGVVDSVRTSVEGDRRAVECKGRTWHGVLAGKRIVPDAGTSHVRAVGTVGDAMADLLRRCGLEGLFKAMPNPARVDYTYARFCDAWSGLLAMLRSSSMRPAMAYRRGRVELYAVPAKTIGGRVDSDLLDFDIERVHRCVNHLVCGGTGENENRAVIHFFANEKGEVSRDQTLFGVDEIAAFYDCSNADEAKLEEDGRKKLEELQTAGEVSADARGGLDAGVGDAVTARDNATGARLTALVEKKTATVDGGLLSVSYTLGKPSIGTSAGDMSGTAETSGGGSTGGGGHAYYAGDGLKLEGFTFSADVTQAELDAAAAKADMARKAASDADAAAGAALAEAKAKAPAKHRHAWGDVDGAPTEYTPKPHTHGAGDIVGGHLAVERGGTGGDSPYRAAINLQFATKTRPQILADGTDLNDIIEPGSYASTNVANKIGNCPTSNTAFRLEVLHPIGSPGFVRQEMSGYWDGLNRFQRFYNGNTRRWTKWEWFPSMDYSDRRYDARYASKTHAHRYAGAATEGGAADSAAKLATPRRIELKGAVTGSAVFDGSGDVSIVTAGDVQAAGFLVAHPVGFYVQTAGADPNAYGGVWEYAPTVGADTWLRKE